MSINRSQAAYLFNTQRGALEWAGEYSGEVRLHLQRLKSRIEDPAEAKVSEGELSAKLTEVLWMLLNVEDILLTAAEPDTTEEID